MNLLSIVLPLRISAFFRIPVSFGLVSGRGGMSLVLPTWSPRRDNINFPTLIEYFTGNNVQFL